MAAALAALMAQHVSVLWVGGFAHWARIVERLRCRDFAAPDSDPCAAASVHTRPSRSIGPGAPHRPVPLDGGRVCARASGVRSIRRHAAAVARDREARAGWPGDAAPWVRRERCCPRSLRRPSTWPAPGCMRGTWRRPPASASSRSWPSSCWRPAPLSGPAIRRGCFELATTEHLSTPGKALDALTFEVDPHTKRSDQVEAGFCFRGRRLSAEPWFPVPWPILDPPDEAQLTREARDAEYEGLPDARPGKRSIGTRIRRTRTPTKNSSGTRCAEPVRATLSTVRRCRS